MYAFSRESNVQIRSILIEKNNNLEIPLFYELETYDTVEVIKGIEKTKGFLKGFAYRSHSENNKYWPHNWVGNIDNVEDYINVVGYAYVTVFCIDTDGSIMEKYISDEVKIRRRRRMRRRLTYENQEEKSNNIYVYIKPCKVVLVEKNIISKHEELSKKAEEYCRINFPFPILGG